MKINLDRTLERPSVFSCDEASETYWRQFLSEFKEHYAPIFAEYGLSLGEGIQIMALDIIGNHTYALRTYAEQDSGNGFD